jgi:hypothetical protein
MPWLALMCAGEPRVWCKRCTSRNAAGIRYALRIVSLRADRSHLRRPKVCRRRRACVNEILAVAVDVLDRLLEIDAQLLHPEEAELETTGAG